MTAHADLIQHLTEGPDCAGLDAQGCAWLLEGGPVPSTDPARLEAILDSPAFEGARHRGAGFLELLWERLRAWFLDAMGSSGAVGFAQWTRTAVLLAAVLLLGWLLWTWIRRRRTMRFKREEALTSGTQVPPLDAPALHLTRAREALSAAPREAIREGLLALLSGLEDAGLIAPGRVRTNRELALALPHSALTAAEVARLAELLSWYDRAFYSLAAVTPADAAAFVGSIRAALLAHAPSSLDATLEAA